MAWCINLIVLISDWHLYRLIFKAVILVSNRKWKQRIWTAWDLAVCDILPPLQLWLEHDSNLTTTWLQPLFVRVCVSKLQGCWVEIITVWWEEGAFTLPMQGSLYFGLDLIGTLFICNDSSTKPYGISKASTALPQKTKKFGKIIWATWQSWQLQMWSLIPAPCKKKNAYRPKIAVNTLLHLGRERWATKKRFTRVLPLKFRLMSFDRKKWNNFHFLTFFYKQKTRRCIILLTVPVVMVKASFVQCLPSGCVNVWVCVVAGRVQQVGLRGFLVGDSCDLSGWYLGLHNRLTCLLNVSLYFLWNVFWSIFVSVIVILLQ